MANLYKYAELAYIGGGFNRGVHSVIEPAAHGCYVSCGPKIELLDEAIEMFNEIAEKLEILSKCRGDGSIKLNFSENKYSLYGPMKKAAVLINDVQKGEKLIIDNIQFKRTKEVTDLSQLNVLESLGSEFTNNLQAGSLLLSKHLKRVE